MDTLITILDLGYDDSEGFDSAESQILQLSCTLFKYYIHLILSGISLSDKTPVGFMCDKSG